MENGSRRPEGTLKAGRKSSDATTVPAVLEFKPLDRAEMWRVDKFDALAAEFEFRAGDWAQTMGWFMAFAVSQTRPWRMVRLLFGVAPKIPPADTHPDDLRLWTRSELQADGYEVQAELDALRTMWRGHLKREGRSEKEEGGNQTVTGPPQNALGLDDQLLERFQFSERIFKITVWDPTAENGNGKGAEIQRPQSENRVERDWFIGRVKEWAKMLGDPIAGPIARSALMNDLYLRRLETEIATAASKNRDRLYEQKGALEEAYQEQVAQLQKMFPEMQVAGRVTFRGVISDLILAHQDYYARADRRLVDKVHTATELEFLMREANAGAERVGPRLRFGLNVAITEAIHGLYDPNFRRQIKPGVLQKIDAAMQAALVAAREAQGEAVVDLEKGVRPGEGDDFPDLNDRECAQCHRFIAQAQCPHCGAGNPQAGFTEERRKAEG
jgi:hypothetical protein